MKLDSHVRSRLRKELAIWLATGGRDGRPHVVPVWFWWDGDSLLVYSLPGQKVRDIESNSKVQLHLNTDPEGEDVIRLDGTAQIVPDERPAFRVAPYVRKYRELMKGYGWTPKVFSDLYRIPIRIQPTRFF